MRIQYQLSNGNWFDAEERADEFLVDACLISQRTKAGFSLISPSEILDRLENGREVRIGTDWYDNIRDADAVERIQAARKASIKRDFPNGKILSCGHIVYFKTNIMSASLGTCCADCYDRMSD